MAKAEIKVATLKHREAKRRNIPTAELEPVMAEEDKSPLRIAYERRNRDLDPQLVWRGKDEQDWSDLVVPAPPLYIQEKVHPKVLIDDLIRETKERAKQKPDDAPDLFADFNGLPDKEAITEFYRHDANWSNRMILGDSLAVMASLAEREGLRGKVQCIYIDPPYAIGFNSNFQWSTTSRDTKDGNKDHITREPEQVKAFRDTWRDGIHSYLTYLRDRLTVARDLLSESGSIFVQIGDENVHRVRALMDEIFGDHNFVALVSFSKTTGLEATGRLSGASDYLLWYSKILSQLKYRPILRNRSTEAADRFTSLQLIDGSSLPAARGNMESLAGNGEWHRLFTDTDLTKPGPGAKFQFSFNGKIFTSGDRWWGTQKPSLERVAKAHRLLVTGSNRLRFVRLETDSIGQSITNNWSEIGGSVQSRSDPKVYVVQTGAAVLQRCLLMTTDPGDLVLDPTCGSGTTAFVAEQWGRRWITIDTSRVALALARARIMGARYQYYLLADSPEGQRKEAEVSRTAPKQTPTRCDVRQGFVYERVPHITLKSIANNAEIDVIWEKYQSKLEELRTRLNATPGRNKSSSRAEGEAIQAAAAKSASPRPSGRRDHSARAWEEWEIPREADPAWPTEARQAHEEWWQLRITRQKEIDASISVKAETEYLYDKPYEDRSRTRVAGPFTVESLSPHRVVAADEDDELCIDPEAPPGNRARRDDDAEETDFAATVLENLRTAGVQQAHKENRINFTSLTAWPGDYIAAVGSYREGERDRRAGIFIGPEFGTVARPDLVAAAREAADAGFHVLIACAFNFDAHSAEFDKLGRIPVLKARMNPDLHMAGELKTTASANLFVIFGEPDIAIEDAGEGMIRVRVKGVDIFRPQEGRVESDTTETIALWMIDTEYNEESFFVRHAYFLGANDPYKALRTTL